MSKRKPTVKLVVTFEVRGIESGDAHHMLNKLLDSGALQLEIEEWAEVAGKNVIFVNTEGHVAC